MTGRPVTEHDFRLPEYRDADPADYELRHDGKPVRKDRWETAVNRIRALVGIDTRDFEISDVVDAVRKLVDDENEWSRPQIYTSLVEPHEQDDTVYDVRLDDGSLLSGVRLRQTADTFSWIWRGVVVEGVAKVREHRDPVVEPVAG